MATPVIMPKFGMAQEEGTILRWLKQEGDRVEKGDILLEVQTDKVDMEVEATASGFLRDVRYGVDATVPVTTVIAAIASEADEARIRAGEPPAPSAAAPATVAAASQAVEVPQPPAGEARGAARVSPVAQRVALAQGLSLEGVEGSGPAGRIVRADVERAGAARFDESPAGAVVAGKVRATPAARRLARAGSVDLSRLSGSGPAGRIQAVDVERAATVHPPVAPPVAPQAPLMGTPLRGVRRTIARRVVQSWSAIPHIFVTANVEMTRAEALRTLLAPEVEAAGGKLTPTIFVAHAAIAALAEHPRLNAHLLEGAGELSLLEFAPIHLGLAVALDEGLVVPVLHDAQALGLAGLAQQAGDLARRARDGSLAPADIEGGTFTISSLGAFPVESFTALIFPPQVAILAVGRAQMEPVWNGSSFAPAPRLRVTLSADHRAVDGATAAAFLATFKFLLEAPERLLL